MKKVFDVDCANDLGYVVNWIRWIYGYTDPDLEAEEVEEADNDSEKNACDQDCENEIDYYELDSEATDDSGIQLFLVSSTGGYEGGGEDAERVFAVAHEDSEVIEYHGSKMVRDALCYVRLTGFYSSYNGTEWGSFELVSPQIVETVVFE